MSTVQLAENNAIGSYCKCVLSQITKLHYNFGEEVKKNTTFCVLSEWHCQVALQLMVCSARYFCLADTGRHIPFSLGTFDTCKRWRWGAKRACDARSDARRKEEFAHNWTGSPNTHARYQFLHIHIQSGHIFRLGYGQIASVVMVEERERQRHTERLWWRMTVLDEPNHTTMFGVNWIIIKVGNKWENHSELHKEIYTDNNEKQIE